MRQAVTNVAWYSDDEDYVSFDEEDLNTGIQDLYDDRSASDAGSDISDDEYYTASNKSPKKLKSKPIAKPQKKRRHKHRHKKDKTKKRKKTNKQGSVPQNKPQKQDDVMEKKSSFFGDLFSGFLGGSTANNNNNNIKTESALNMEQNQCISPKKPKSKSRSRSISISYTDSDEDDDESSSSSYSLPKRKGRSKISKRINKLSEMKRQKEKKQRTGKRKVVHKQKVNAKVISIELGTLKQSAQNIATGDPMRCKNEKCGAILSKYDKLLKQYDDIKLDDDDESIWICSFCNTINIIEIDAEEMPQNETIDYILEPPEENKDNNNASNYNECDKQIIFCIDISGSMCVSQAVEGKKINLKGNRLQKENENLSEFIDPMNRNQWMPHQSQNVTYISRLQAVQAAVDEQIAKLKLTNPNMKVGLVTFNNEVMVYGDAMKDEEHGFEIIAGDKLNNLSKLKEIGVSDKCKIRHGICDAHECLSNELWKLEESGQTALGPALSVAIAMTTIKRGSQVILCTDGLANIGVGKMDENNENNENICGEFYANLGNWALENGVCVSIISITDDGCKLEDLGKIVEITGGNLRRINPLKLTDKFAGIIEQEIIATLSNAKMLIHPGLKFVDIAKNLKNLNPFAASAAVADDDNKTDKMGVIKEDEIEKNKNERKIYVIDRSQQDVGNVFADTTVFFEYEVRKDKISEFKDLKYLPFQVHILYNKNNGSKMLRVITQQKEVTMDSAKVRENLDFKILSKYSTRVTTKLCGVGDYEASRAWTQANVRYMHQNVSNNDDLITVASHVNSNVALDYQMGQQQINEKISIANNNDNGNDNKKKGGWTWRNLMAQKSQNDEDDNNDNGDAEQDNNNNTSTWSWRGSNNQKYRSTQRNDKFSSLTYGMKKKY